MERTNPAATLPIRSITDAEPPEEVNAAVPPFEEHRAPGQGLLLPEGPGPVNLLGREHGKDLRNA